MATRIPPEERLISLVVALMATHSGLSRKQIIESVSGYRHRLESGTKADAIERMFERDKEELRRLGIPLQSLTPAGDEGNTRETRYRIPSDQYDLPPDIVFSPAEYALLELAGSVWQASAQSAQAQAGVRKIRALGVAGTDPLTGFTPRISAPGPAFSMLQQAIEDCSEVAFSYLKPADSQPTVRRLFPLALVESEGRWHIWGHDPVVHQTRTFLLSRMLEVPQRTGLRFDSSLRDSADEQASADLQTVKNAQVATIAVQPDTNAALLLSRRSGPGQEENLTQLAPGAEELILRVPYLDAAIFADELAGAGPEVRVVAPTGLADLVVARLKRIAQAHSQPIDATAFELVTSAAIGGESIIDSKPTQTTTQSALPASDKVQLYLTLVPYLLEHGQVPLEVAAADFGVTASAMVQMVKHLTVMGTPGDDGLVQLPQDLFDINWDLLENESVIEITHDVGLRRVPRFSSPEASALLAGLGFLLSLPDVAERSALLGLQTKLSQATAARPPDVVVIPTDVDSVRVALTRALRQNRVVTFNYHGLDSAPTIRRVDPLRILNHGSTWYLQGWCHLREAVRTFHLDRINQVEATNIPITHDQQAVPELFASTEGPYHVTLKLPEALIPLLLSRFPSAQVAASATTDASLGSVGVGTVTAVIAVSNPLIIRRLISGLGESVLVVAPAKARAATRDWARAGLDQYRDNPTTSQPVRLE